MAVHDSTTAFGVCRGDSRGSRGAPNAAGGSATGFPGVVGCLHPDASVGMPVRSFRLPWDKALCAVIDNREV